MVEINNYNCKINVNNNVLVFFHLDSLEFFFKLHWKV